MKGDFTRSTFKKKKHYSSVRMQQGRVQMDADWNEQLDIQAHFNRTEAIDVIGRAGVPKYGGGFFISEDNGDLKISAGRIYVDGILCENEEETTYKTQPHFPDPPVDFGNGIHMVYLDVWERHITALDDEGIREKALGGPDTGTRTQIIWQVKLQETRVPECDQVGPGWQPDNAKSNGLLSARAEPGDTSDDPCILTPNAGYKRLENQLYRVEIHDSGTAAAGSNATFKWSRDNGTIAAWVKDISGDIITVSHPVQTRLKEFSAGEWIEVTDDAHELQGIPGTLVKIDNVEGDEITVDSTTATGTLTQEEFPLNQNPKVRRWDSDGLVNMEIPTDNDGFIILEDGDGVEVKFEKGDYKTGDYWLIPARSATGDVEWPKDASNQPIPKPPDGIKHHYCQLAVVRVNNGKFQVIQDCIDIFPPLIEIKVGASCCTVTVGDGKSSSGDVNSLEMAVGLLPASGGEICLLPGNHKANVVIREKSNITIRGCGAKARVIPRANKTGDPLFLIEDSNHIILEDMKLETQNGTAVKITTAAADESSGVQVRNTHITAYKHAVQVESGSQITIINNEIRMIDEQGADTAVYMLAENSVIKNNSIRVKRRADHYAARGGIQIAGGSENIEIIGNRINGGSGNGITLGSSLDSITIPEEDIETAPGIKHWFDYKGGHLYGLAGYDERTPAETTGFLLVRKEDNARYVKFTDSKGYFRLDDLPQGRYGLYTAASNTDVKKIKVNPAVRVDKISINDVRIVISEVIEENIHIESQLAAVSNVHIHHNAISNMELNGIGPAEIYDLEKVEVLINTDFLTITLNEITQCLQRVPDPDVAGAQNRENYYGGIVLSDGEHMVIKNNRIQNNGILQTAPVSGIFVYHSEGLDISGNIVLNNGPQEKEKISEGLRGGIVVKFGTVSTREIIVTVLKFKQIRNRQDGFPAVTVHDNIVVAPLGQALFVSAMGPVSVLGNRFTSKEVAYNIDQARFWFPLVAGTVFIANYGRSNEVFFQFFTFETLRKMKPPVEGAVIISERAYIIDTEKEQTLEELDIMANGNVLFADNQCVFDLVESRVSMALSSVVISSLDNINFHNNQLDNNLAGDVVYSNTALYAPSVLATGNRFKAGVLNEIYSLYSYGTACVTANNIGTHCFKIVAPLKKGEDENIVIADVWKRCTITGPIIGDLSKGQDG